jgi:hypothetical protein
MNEKEKEIKAVVREILSDKDSYKTTLKTALKFLNKALKSSGDELKEDCLYILGNSISWEGPNYVELKNKLRKFAFRDAVSNRSKNPLKGS